MATPYTSPLHVFGTADVAGSTEGDPADIDFTATPFVDNDGNTLYPVDSTFGFYVTDFVGAEDKVFDGIHEEGFVGDMTAGFPAVDELPPGATPITGGLAVRNTPTDVFKSGGPLGTWQVSMGGQNPVKASSEHYATMAALLSDQAFAEDPDAIRTLDNDLRVLDLEESGGLFTAGALHLQWVEELSNALQAAIDNVETNGDTAPDQVLNDIDFDRDGTVDPDESYRITTQTVNFDGDGVPEPTVVGAVDLGDDGSIDMVDGVLNGFGGEADITDILEPNETSVISDIAFSQDYSVTVKDDGKLLYRWGEAVKRPNDIRTEVNLALPEEWTADNDGNGIADGLDNGGFVITKAELVIRHNITNNPNDQVRPEDYENEAAIGRLPAHYIIEDPDDPDNTLWVSPRDSFDGSGNPLPSYLVLDGNGDVVDSDVPPPNSTPVFDPDGTRVGYRNDLVDGTVLRDFSLIAKNAAADLEAVSEDLLEGFTDAWYTTVDREPFEWSYDTDASPYINDFVSFRSPEEAAAEGHTDDDLASGPRWRLTPNKIGQDLPGLEVPKLGADDSILPPPYRKDDIKYPTGEVTTTTLNLLDWEGDESPLQTSLGWMTVNKGEMDVDADGVIDEGWTKVNGDPTLGAGDPMPEGLVLSAISPNGVQLEAEFLDTAVYVKGDRQDSANLYDIQLHLEYDQPVPDAFGAVQSVSANHVASDVTYLEGADFDAPVVIAMPPTFAGTQAASVAISNVTSTGATVRIKEPDYLDGFHATEDVSLLTMESGNWTLADGTDIEVGTVAVPGGETDVFSTVTFAETFEETPVVLAQLQTETGADWTIVRTDNITTAGFDFALQEQEANAPSHPVAEILGYIAVDAEDASGLIDFDDLQAQAFTAGGVSHEGGSYTFDEAVGLDPLISAGLASFNGPDTATLRLTDLTNDGTAATADFLAQEEQSLDDEIWHAPEDVSGVAFESAGLLVAPPMPMDIA